MNLLKLLILLERNGIEGPYRAGDKLISLWDYQRRGPLPMKIRLLLRKYKKQLLPRVLTTRQAGIPDVFVAGVLA